MKRMLPTLVGVSVLASLTPIGRAQQVPFPWSDEVRLTDHPDSSFSDWPASVPMGHARTRDCLHVIWRDYMLRTEDCVPSHRCWHYVHQLGWARDWSGEEGAGGTTGICMISGPNYGGHHDNAGNIGVDGAGRAHFVWESYDTSTLRVRYRWRDAVVDKVALCSSFQRWASEEGDSTCAEHGWPDGREVVVSDPAVDSANPTLLLDRPDFSSNPADSEIVHVFYHDSRALHRWRSAGNPDNDWSMGVWWPPGSAAVVVEAPPGEKVGSVSAAIDTTTGRLYVAYARQLAAPPPNDTVTALGVATAAGPGQTWVAETIAPSDEWTAEAAPVIAVGTDGRAYFVWSECQNCGDDDTEISRVMFRVREGASWGDSVVVSADALSWDPGTTPHSTRPHLVTYEPPEGPQAHVVWTRRDAEGNRRIVHRYLRSDGDPAVVNDWSAPAVIADSPIGVSGAKLHAEGAQLFVTWQDHRWRQDPTTPKNTEIYHRWGPTPVGSGIAERSAEGPPGFRAFSPNPFRAETVALLTVVSGADPVRVVVALYDVGGRKVREMAAEAKAGRAYEVHWDGRSQSGAVVAPGVYFARVSVGSDLLHQGKLVYVR